MIRMMNVKLMFNSGAIETVQPSTTGNKRQRTTRSQQQTPIVIPDEEPTPQPIPETIQAGLDGYKHRQEATERENEKLLAELEVLRTYKQQQEVKKHNAWGLTTEVEGLKASTRQQSAELDLLRTYKQQQECKEHTAQDLAAELEEIKASMRRQTDELEVLRAYKQQQECNENTAQDLTAELEELKASTQQQSVELDVLREWHKGHETELFKSTNLSTELEHLRRAHKELQETIKLDQAEARERRKTLSPVQLLEELQATKRRRMKRVQGLKDQMKKANTIHETSPRRELDQENERLQQAIILVEQVTGLQRTIKYAEEELSKPLFTYGELGDTFEERESHRQKIRAERQDEVEPRKKKAEADLEKLWSRIQAARL
jgi:hypothetical protein